MNNDNDDDKDCDDDDNDDDDDDEVGIYQRAILDMKRSFGRAVGGQVGPGKLQGPQKLSFYWGCYD